MTERQTVRKGGAEDYHSCKFSHSDHTSQAGKALMEQVKCKVEARLRGLSETPGHLASVASSSPDTFPKEATAPAEGSSRKAEIQVNVGRTRSAPYALYNSSKILIRLRNELESKANSQLSYGSGGNLLCHSNTLTIYSPRLC